MINRKKAWKRNKNLLQLPNINKIFLKNRYLLLFIKRILTVIYQAKLFIKLNVIAVFKKV